MFGAYRAAIVHFSSLYVKFNLDRFPGIMISCVMLVIGQDSLTKMVTPLASDRRELKNSLCLVAFWNMCSVSFEVRVSTRQKILERSLFSLLKIFLVFILSPIELTFQEVSLTSSSRDFVREVSFNEIFGISICGVF